MKRLLLNAMLTLLCLWFAAESVRAAFFAEDPERPAARAAAGRGEAEEVAVRVEMPPRAAFAAIAARPLFDPDRRPPVVVRAAAPVADLPPPDLRLTGVARSGGVGRAIVSLAGAPVQLVAPGERIAGWRVAALTSRSIVLERDGERVTVRLGETEAEREIRRASRERAGAQRPGRRDAPRRAQPLVDMAQIADDD